MEKWCKGKLAADPSAHRLPVEAADAKIGSHEIARCECFLGNAWISSGNSRGFRPNHGTDSKSICQPNRPTSGTDEEDRRAECEDRHALAANFETSARSHQSSAGRHDWRGRAIDLSINVHTDNLDIDVGS